MAALRPASKPLGIRGSDKPQPPRRHRIPLVKRLGRCTGATAAVGLVASVGLAQCAEAADANSDELTPLAIAALWQSQATDGCETAVAMALALSRGDCTARKAVIQDGSVNRGLFQLNDDKFADCSDKCAYDCKCNTGCAMGISDHGKDWSPWSDQMSALQTYHSYVPVAVAACKQTKLSEKADEEDAKPPATSSGAHCRHDSPKNACGPCQGNDVSQCGVLKDQPDVFLCIMGEDDQCVSQEDGSLTDAEASDDSAARAKQDAAKETAAEQEEQEKKQAKEDAAKKAAAEQEEQEKKQAKEDAAKKAAAEQEEQEKKQAKEDAAKKAAAEQEEQEKKQAKEQDVADDRTASTEPESEPDSADKVKAAKAKEEASNAAKKEKEKLREQAAAVALEKEEAKTEEQAKKKLAEETSKKEEDSKSKQKRTQEDILAEQRKQDALKFEEDEAEEAKESAKKAATKMTAKVKAAEIAREKALREAESLLHKAQQDQKDEEATKKKREGEWLHHLEEQKQAAQAWVHDLHHADGEDCYEPCHGKAGICAWCGSGACCREGFEEDPVECYGAGGKEHHECIDWRIAKQRAELKEENKVTDIKEMRDVQKAKDEAKQIAEEQQKNTAQRAAYQWTHNPQHLGEDCWSSCHEKAGFCEWCGSGACCRHGYSKQVEECYNTGGETFHECIDVEKGKKDFKDRQAKYAQQKEEQKKEEEQAKKNAAQEEKTKMDLNKRIVKEKKDAAKNAKESMKKEADAWAHNLQHVDRDCFDACAKKTGFCDFCGNGACCRKGWANQASECYGLGGTGFHACIDVVQAKKQNEITEEAEKAKAQAITKKAELQKEETEAHLKSLQQQAAQKIAAQESKAKIAADNAEARLKKALKAKRSAEAQASINLKRAQEEEAKKKEEEVTRRKQATEEEDKKKAEEAEVEQQAVKKAERAEIIWAHHLQHDDGSNCWDHCHQRSGFCHYCGSGACCRAGYPGQAAECYGQGGENVHQCINIDEAKNAAEAQMQARAMKQAQQAAFEKQKALRHHQEEEAREEAMDDKEKRKEFELELLNKQHEIAAAEDSGEPPLANLGETIKTEADAYWPLLAALATLALLWACICVASVIFKQPARPSSSETQLVPHKPIMDMEHAHGVDHSLASTRGARALEMSSLNEELSHASLLLREMAHKRAQGHDPNAAVRVLDRVRQQIDAAERNVGGGGGDAYLQDRGLYRPVVTFDEEASTMHTPGGAFYDRHGLQQDRLAAIRAWGDQAAQYSQGRPQGSRSR
eukprot:TRINITY_DN1409_c0_g1_i4.p1 TRINITY_DN1409_c0_g1~~TRINITY_DN1409_c0_g1_i4.p1  ORF type:complete len:1269 (-),score=397.31 TRINITY_DN1409_c0_g1_i4:270-4076(-)